MDTLKQILAIHRNLNEKKQHPCTGLSEDDPCWKDYEQIGTKKKGGKTVPNCVPKESTFSEKFKPYTIKGSERVTDLYIQFKSKKFQGQLPGSDQVAEKDWNQAKKIVTAYSKQHKLNIKDAPGAPLYGDPREGSSAFKISIFAKNNTNDKNHDLRPLYTQLSKLKTAEDHGVGLAKPIKEETVSENAKIKKMLSKMKGISTTQAQMIAQIPIPVLTQISQALGQLVMSEEHFEEVSEAFRPNPEIRDVKKLDKMLENAYKSMNKLQNGKSLYLRKCNDGIVDARRALDEYVDAIESGKLAEGYYSDKDKKQKDTLKKHDKRMIKISKDSIKKYEKGRKEETEVEEDRDYKKEYDTYHSDPEQIKRRAARNSARKSLEDDKKLTKDKDVHHKDNNPLNNDKKNLSIVSQHYNRREPRLRERLVKRGVIKNGKRK